MRHRPPSVARVFLTRRGPPVPLQPWPFVSFETLSPMPSFSRLHPLVSASALGSRDTMRAVRIAACCASLIALLAADAFAQPVPPKQKPPPKPPATAAPTAGPGAAPAAPPAPTTAPAAPPAGAAAPQAPQP